MKNYSHKNAKRKQQKRFSICSNFCFLPKVYIKKQNFLKNPPCIITLPEKQPLPNSSYSPLKFTQYPPLQGVPRFDQCHKAKSKPSQNRPKPDFSSGSQVRPETARAYTTSGALGGSPGPQLSEGGGPAPRLLRYSLRSGLCPACPRNMAQTNSPAGGSSCSRSTVRCPAVSGHQQDIWWARWAALLASPSRLDPDVQVQLSLQGISRGACPTLRQRVIAGRRLILEP